MPKMIVSIDGVVIKEVQLTKDRTTLGRRPYNDIVIDNLAVSGEHAVMQMTGNEVYLEDLNSTNGTYINGKAAKKQLLQNPPHDRHCSANQCAQACTCLVHVISYASALETVYVAWASIGNFEFGTATPVGHLYFALMVRSWPKALIFTSSP